jgi:hypothetical protein
MRLLNRVWEQLTRWLDWHGRVATLLAIIVSLGGAALGNRLAAIWANVTGIYLWVVSALVFVLFMCGLLLLPSRALDFTRKTLREELGQEHNLDWDSILLGTMGTGPYQRQKMSLFVRNEPKTTEAVATASVRAALRWKRGEHIRNVSPLKWYPSEETAIDIGVGEVAELILGTKNPTGNWDFGVNASVGPTDAIWIDEQPFEFEIRLLNTKNGRLLKLRKPWTFRWDWRETAGHTSRPWIVPIEPPKWTL